MNYLTLFLVGTLASLAIAQDASANPAAPIQVSDLKPLLIRAIDQGFAQGVLVGEAATYVRQKFESPAPIEIDVRTLYALPQPGCSRLEVTIRQKDVLEKAKRSDKELVYQVSYCRDGRFPGSEKIHTGIHTKQSICKSQLPAVQLQFFIESQGAFQNSTRRRL